MDKTTELLTEVLTMLCDIQRGYQTRELHKNPAALIEEVREHLERNGVTGDGAWDFE